MPTLAAATAQLEHIPHLTLRPEAPLREYTRFGIGGPADLLAETSDEQAFCGALQVARGSGLPYVVIGGGTNLIVADEGFPGLVLRFRADKIRREGDEVTADSGAVLQDLVDFSIREGLQGLETLTGIPGSVGAAVYGNAGAYGHSMSERVTAVRFFDGQDTRTFDNAACEFHYRESIFKRQKEWIIFSTRLLLQPADSGELKAIADKILTVRNAKYPPTMKCAGSVFKNFLFQELPPAVREELPAKVVIEGKVPAAYFLEQVGAKGLKNGGMHVADYHANLIYNVGDGRASELRSLIDDLKSRVRDRYGLALEEEVQYVGFSDGR